MNTPPINLTKLLAACKVGQTVKLRNGTVTELTEIKPESAYPYAVCAEFGHFWFKPNGILCIAKEQSENDIIDILPPFLHLPS